MFALLKGFPFWQMTVVLIVRFSEPISFTSLFPYLYFMIRDFHITDNPAEISRYSGYLALSFAFAQFLCSIHWGQLLDRVGRKVVLQTGLAGSALALLVFGFATNYYIALAARTLAGALNGNIAVLQTTVGELVTDRRHQGIAFSALPLLWNIGCVVGPLIGSSKLLTRPRMDAEQLHAYSLYDDFVQQHPYAMSNVVVALCLMFSTMCCFLFLEETNPKVKDNYDIGLALGDWLRRLVGVKTPIRPWSSLHVALEAASEEAIVESDDETTLLLDPELQPLYSENIGDLEIASQGDPETLLTARSTEAIRRYSEALSLHPTTTNETTSGGNILQAFRNREIFSDGVLRTMLLYFSLSFHSLIYSEFLPVLLASTYTPKLLEFPWHMRGGFGWDTQSIGHVLSITGFVGSMVIVFLFPFLDRHFRTIYIFRAASVTFPIAYFLLPYVLFAQNNEAVSESTTSVFLYACAFTVVLGTALSFPNAVILLHRATKAQHRALVNSANMSSTSLARFLAPLCWGSLISLCDSNGVAQLPWAILAALSLVTLIYTFSMDEGDEDLK